MGDFNPKPLTIVENCRSPQTEDHRSPPNISDNRRSPSTTADHSMGPNSNIILNDNNHIAACVNKAFDDLKAGVKGIDSGVTKIPRIFIDQGIILEKNNTDCSNNQLSVPIIALQGINEDSALRAEVINQVRNACANWGFFQVIHHGIPVSVLDEMIDGICQFHEQNTEVKKQFYTRDATRKVLYLRNYDLYKPKATNWRDSLGCIMSLDDPAHPQSCLKFAEDNMSTIIFSGRVHQILCKSVSRTIFVKLLGRKIGYHAISNKIYSLWKPSTTIMIMDLENDYYLVKLHEEAGYVRAFTKGVLGFMYRRSVIKSIGEIVCEAVSNIKMDGRVQKVEYESLPNVCFACGYYGPMKKLSPALYFQEKQGGVEEYGPWMIVDLWSMRADQSKGSSKDDKVSANLQGSQFNALQDFRENELGDVQISKLGIIAKSKG
ncbi:uncharacterized protein [Gossypium hirsutum]|uniref:Non-haem dioxygenase N-terminal domain-containing protein n=1 Tax=Gossypium hirsutum TaxID=3635 RepID=A0A1U8MFS7_GOSHI|nr:uncharacterized protein LOC107936234 [Gossypium hirsutum]